MMVYTTTLDNVFAVLGLVAVLITMIVTVAPNTVIIMLRDVVTIE